MLVMRVLTTMLLALTVAAVGPAQEPTEEQQADLKRLAREWGYVQARAQATAALVGETEALTAIAAAAAQKIAAANAGDLSLLAGWGPLGDPGMQAELLDAAPGLRESNKLALRAVQGPVVLQRGVRAERLAGAQENVCAVLARMTLLFQTTNSTFAS